MSTSSNIAGSVGLNAAGAIPVVGSIISALFGGLLKAHEARVKGATNENALVAQLIPIVDQNLRAIFAALNAGQITETDAIGYLEQIQQNFFQNIAQLSGPGIAAMPCGSIQPYPNGCATNTPCDKKCTAGCCVGCNVVAGAISNAIGVIQAGGGSFDVCNEGPSAKYGNPGRPGYSLTYSPGQHAGGVLGQAEGTLNGLFGGGTTFGGTSSGGINLMLIIFAAFALFLGVRLLR